MQILWLNWRDIHNPEAGGAEVLTHEIATRLVRKFGCDVTLFTSQFEGAEPQIDIDGVRTIRAGGKFEVYRKAVQYYKRYGNNFQLVIDEINVKPFLAPKFVNKKTVVALIHQISPEQFTCELSFPLGFIGRHFLEKRWLSHYKRVPTVTVSESTKLDLLRMGFGKISIIPEGVSVTPLNSIATKESVPTVVFIGRLKKHKLPHHALLAFSLIKQKMPEAKLWVIGDGYMHNKLKGMKIKDVEFFGHVTNEKKYELLKSAHMILVPAIREGWGLVVTESNAMGTPAVAYNVPGLRDSIKDGQTGLLTRENSPQELASMAISLFREPLTLNRISANAIAFSRQFSWDKSAEIFYRILQQQMGEEITTAPPSST